jgi:hypothetical protein
MNDQFLLQFPSSKDFDAITSAVGKATSAQQGFIDLRSFIKLVQGLQVHRDVARAMSGVVETTFRNTPDQRHLASLKSNANGAARPRGLPFPAPAAGFSVTAGFTLPQSFAAVLSSGTRLEIV